MDILCRERLCLLCLDRSIDMVSPPNLPAIWTDRPRSVSAVLKLNVDAVIAQVNMDSTAASCVSLSSCKDDYGASLSFDAFTQRCHNTLYSLSSRVSGLGHNDGTSITSVLFVRIIYCDGSRSMP